MSDMVGRLNTALGGRYAIEREIGEGGMATVYLASDLKHERKVALKVLKPELAAVVGAERFLAEIKTTANLQHPNILPLHDSGEADGFLFYVMPYVEGDTLKDRLGRENQLPVADAVDIATDMAEALDYAHRQGVIHRDIKPANVLMLEGKPVISDFGIALAVGAAGGGRLTETGLSLGTPHYMSPEQATGDQAVGAASDIYSLGSVLYEMLVGEPAFPGSTAQAVLGKIIAGEPVSATKHRPSIPANVDAAIRKALEKLPADRFTSAQDFARALADPGFKYGEEGAVLAADSGRWKAIAIGATGLAAVSVAFGAWGLLQPEPTQRMSRFEVIMPEGLRPDLSSGVGLAISPDGTEIVFVGRMTGPAQLWRRPLGQLMPTPMAGTENARNPRFSPDGASVAFTGGGRITIASLAGAPPFTPVLDSVQNTSGIAWGPDEMIYFGKINFDIWRVPATGGPDERVTTLAEGELSHRWPDVLPNGRGLLFTLSSRGAPDVIATLDFETGETETLFQGAMARYAHSGHIVYTAGDGTLSAVPFDQDRLAVTGAARTLLEGIQMLNELDSYFALSETGDLLYLPGDVGTFTETQLVWVSRSGVDEPVAVDWRFNSPTDNYGWRLSPDGGRVAVTEQSEGNVDIRIKALPDGPVERLTFGDSDETFPQWSPDGQWVTYVSGEGLDLDAWRKRSDGTGDPELLLDDAQNLLQPRWSADGEWMVFRTSEGAVGRDIVGFRPGEDNEATMLLGTDFTEWGPDLSPNGLWLAYSSDETDREEVYARPFPNVDSTRVPISNEGGSNPRWSHSGDELFYVDASGRFVVVQVQMEPEFRVTDREPLFELGIEYLVGDGGDDFYDLSLDDQRFLMGRRVGADEGVQRYVVVQNFFEELRVVVPE